ncbi:MAG: tRNA (adenosine(37)-N6)-threonylcarbamoyltransferase complex dimerization subunit type 1 TsaB [Bacteroidota bacterium]|nr:tRNA (adenosine(37)-N6)-threonylcarbamoyltransferase complex dimerization subunit type 1 TsaB [Bacteroidota bacterium]
MILGIETASLFLGAAAVENGSIRASVRILRRNVHDELLVPVLREVIRWAGGAGTLRAVAVSSGPGSFTGLRIGMSAAKGLAVSLGIPIVLVPTHAAIARRFFAREPRDEGTVLAVVSDAKGDEVFVSIHRLTGTGIMEIQAPGVRSITELARDLPQDIHTTGDGAAKLDAASPGRFRLDPDATDAADAGTVARIGEEYFVAGRIADIEACEPFYLRDFRPTQPKPLSGRKS